MKKALLKNLGYLKDVKENNQIQNLLKIPKKDNGYNTINTQNFKKNHSHQIDILFLPTDKTIIDSEQEIEELKQINEYLKSIFKPTKEIQKYIPLKKTYYRYLLTAVDLATGTIDLEPIKFKYSFYVRDKLKKIYKRKYLKIPELIEVDDGSEFKGEFKEYFEQQTDIRYKEPGRHRQQSVIETVNARISEIVNLEMLNEELLNDNIQSTNWVDIIPNLVKEYNKIYSHPAKIIDALEVEPIRVKKGSIQSQILEIGTKVRVQLDNPITTDDRRLHGQFRKGDFRYEKTPKQITRIYFRPGQPPLYQVGGNENVAYTRNQLQLYDGKEVGPNKDKQKKFGIKKIIRKYKSRNKMYYEILWSDDSKTSRLVSELQEEAPNTTKAFEDSIKKK